MKSHWCLKYGLDYACYVSTLCIIHHWHCSICLGLSQTPWCNSRWCVSAAAVFPSLLWHLGQSVILLPLVGMLRCFELPFLSFCLSSAFLCAGLKRNCWATGRILQLFLTQLYMPSPEECWTKVCFVPFLLLTSYPISASYCKFNCIASLCSFCISTTLHLFIKNKEELACEGEHGWCMPGSLFWFALIWGFCQETRISCHTTMLCWLPSC